MPPSSCHLEDGAKATTHLQLESDPARSNEVSRSWRARIYGPIGAYIVNHNG